MAMMMAGGRVTRDESRNQLLWVVAAWRVTLSKWKREKEGGLLFLGMGLTEAEAVGGVRESVSRRETGWRACVQACVPQRWSASTYEEETREKQI